MLSSSNYHGNLNRAELLFKVFKYTEWEKERGKDQPFTFCIIGQSVVGIADNFPENYKINERIILPKQIKKLEEIGFKIAVMPLTLMSANVKTMQETLKNIQNKTYNKNVSKFTELMDVVGFNDYFNLEDKYNK